MRQVFENDMLRDTGGAQRPFSINGPSEKGFGAREDSRAIPLRTLGMHRESASAFPETRTHVRYFLAFWLFILSGVAFLDRTNISITGLQISKEYGIGNQELGWIFSAFLIGYAAFQVPAGWLAARFGPRRVLTFGVLSWCAATLLTGLLPMGVSQAILLLVSIRLVLGAGESVIYPAANQFVARWVPLRERGITNGLILAGVGAGSGLTPPILTWLVVSYGWRVAFWFSSVIGIAVCAVWWQTSRDTPEEHPAVSKLELREIHEGLSYMPSAPSESSAPVISWSAILHRKDLPALMAGYFSFGYIAWIFFSWFFLYMAQERKFDLKASAYYSMLPFLSMTVCCLAGGVLSDKLTERFGLRVGRCWLAAAAQVLDRSVSRLWLAGAQLRSRRSHSGRRRRRSLSLPELLLVCIGGHCRAKHGRLLEHYQHGRSDWRRGHGFADAVDRRTLRLDHIVCHRSGAGHRQRTVLAHRSSGEPNPCPGRIIWMVCRRPAQT